MGRRHWRMGMDEFRRSWSRQAFVAALRRLIPEIGVSDLERAPSGIRAMAVMRDGTWRMTT